MKKFETKINRLSRKYREIEMKSLLGFRKINVDITEELKDIFRQCDKIEIKQSEKRFDSYLFLRKRGRRENVILSIPEIVISLKELRKLIGDK